MQNNSVDLSQLVSEWYPKISSFASRIKLPPYETKDLVQELTLHLFKITKKYKHTQGSFNTFAWTCLRNKARTLIRQGKKKEKSLFGEPFSWEEVDFKIECNKVFLDLKNNQKQVLIALLKGFKKNEIASKLRVGQSRISGILKELRNNIVLREVVK